MLSESRIKIARLFTLFVIQDLFSRASVYNSKQDVIVLLISIVKQTCGKKLTFFNSCINCEDGAMFYLGEIFLVMSTLSDISFVTYD